MKFAYILAAVAALAQADSSLQKCQNKNNIPVFWTGTQCMCIAEYFWRGNANNTRGKCIKRCINKSRRNNIIPSWQGDDVGCVCPGS